MQATLVWKSRKSGCGADSPFLHDDPRAANWPWFHNTTIYIVDRGSHDLILILPISINLGIWYSLTRTPKIWTYSQRMTTIIAKMPIFLVCVLPSDSVISFRPGWTMWMILRKVHIDCPLYSIVHTFLLVLVAPFKGQTISLSLRSSVTQLFSKAIALQWTNSKLRN